MSLQEQKNVLLRKSVEEKEKEVSEEKKRNDALAESLSRSGQVREVERGDAQAVKQVKELEAELKKKEEFINELQDKLVNTETLNDFLQFSVQNPMEETKSQSDMEAALEAEKATSKRACEEMMDVSNSAVMFVYTLCEICSGRGISPALCDRLIRTISHLGTRTVNKHFKEDVMRIIGDATTLVDTSLTRYLEESEKRYSALETAKETELSQLRDSFKKQTELSQLRDSFKKQTELMKARLQQLEDLDTSTMNTMVSLDPQDGDAATQNTLTYLRQQNERLSAENQLYRSQINDKSTYMRTALDRSSSGAFSFHGSSPTEDPTTLKRELEKEKGERLLWKIRAEQMEVLVGESVENRTCLTNYELSVLATVIDNLFNWVMDHFVIDFEMDVAIEPLEEEYTRSVQQMENREPTIMEIKLYAIQRIIELAANYFLESKYQLEMDVESERDRRQELEMELKR